MAPLSLSIEGHCDAYETPEGYVGTYGMVDIVLYRIDAGAGGTSLASRALVRIGIFGRLLTGQD